MDGSELRSLRSRLGLTQAKLAQAVEVTPNTIARWERGEVPIPSHMVLRLDAVAEAGQSGAAITRPRGVVIDPHHKAILEALGGPLEPDVFEACASDLIRLDGWCLVPVRGGHDDGFDGAVADGTGDPFPLVSTTSQDLVGNLKRNLKRVRRSGWQVDRAIFATSRRITPNMRGKLFGAAKELGIDLVQTYDQDWFANRLYRNPGWCKRLLHITGRPHALSVFPKSPRPTPGNEVIGREQETRWLTSRRSDCLVIGVPGSGKTFLLRSLALQGQALFLVDDDLEQMANDLRELQPGAVIIDDAHVDPSLIESFAQVRRQVGAEHIPVIATCWPSERDAVQSALQVSSEDVLVLELIDADTMVKIIKAAGVQGPNELIAAIREQADGRPGLAATLASLCIKGDVRQVVTGEALINQLTPQLNRMLDFDSKRFLAPFAVAGDGGLKQADAAQLLGMSEFEVASKLADLAIAGVVRETPSQTVSVDPRPMRWVLVRDIFFGGVGSLDYAPFLQVAENRHDVLEALIGAYSRGASIPDLLPRLQGEESSRLWSTYASVGPRETEYVVEKHPELVVEIAGDGLIHAPETIIPKLLDEVRDEQQAFGYHRYDPLQKIESWALNPFVPAQEISYRRSKLVRLTREWWERTSNTQSAARAMCIAFSPKLDGARLDPGTGRTVNIARAQLPIPMLRELTDAWPTLLDILRDAKKVPWDEIQKLIWEWHYGDPDAETDDGRQSLMRDFAKLMVLDLVDATRDHPGIQHKLGLTAKRIDVDVDLLLDPEFEAVYEQTKTFDPEGSVKIGKVLAKRWSNKSIQELGASLERICNEARLASVYFPPWSLVLSCERLAKSLPNPETAAQELMRRGLPGELVGPFLRHAASKNHAEWVALVDFSLGQVRYQPVALYSVLTHPDPPKDLLSKALSLVTMVLVDIETWCLRGEVPTPTLKAILCGAESRVALSAATGHWCAEPRGRIEKSLERPWRRAIIRSARFDDHDPNGSGYWLSEILSTDGELAADWMLAKMRSGDRSFYVSVEQLAGKAIAAMDTVQRRKVILGIPTNLIWMPPEIIRFLVGNDLSLYKELLGSSDHSRFHLWPLTGQPNRFWLQKAMLALDAGHLADPIIDAAFAGGLGWRGDESKMWAERRVAFEALVDEAHANPRAMRLARRGAEIMGEYESQAMERERYEAIHVVS